MLLHPAPQKFNTFNTFNTFNAVSNSNYGRCDRPPGTPNDHTRTDGHGSHQNGDCLWRQRLAGEPDDDECGSRRQPNQHHTIGEMAGARRS
jgi:hypothetical protein